MFICNKVDPDAFFSNTSFSPLSTSYLLAFLQLLSQKLDTDTDLKFRYIENLLICLNDSSSDVKEHFNDDRFRPTLELLSQALTCKLITLFSKYLLFLAQIFFLITVCYGLGKLLKY